MAYRHVQWGWTWLLYLIFALVVGGITVAGVGESGDEESAWVLAFTVVLLVAIFVVVLLFSRLEVTVDSENVTAASRFGRPKTVVALDDIVSVREVRNSWWQGGGVRRISNGWMYNVWGSDAVQIMTSEGSVFRVGTGGCERLAAALILR